LQLKLEVLQKTLDKKRQPSKYIDTTSSLASSYNVSSSQFSSSPHNSLLSSTLLQTNEKFTSLTHCQPNGNDTDSFKLKSNSSDLLLKATSTLNTESNSNKMISNGLNLETNGFSLSSSSSTTTVATATIASSTNTNSESSNGSPNLSSNSSSTSSSTSNSPTSDKKQQPPELQADRELLHQSKIEMKIEDENSFTTEIEN